MDEYFHIDKLKSDYFKGIALEFHDADPDIDFEAIESIIVPLIGTEKCVTVNRSDIFLKQNKGSIEYYVPEIMSPVPALLLDSIWFTLYIKEKETDVHPKLKGTIVYNGRHLQWASGYEPDVN